MRQRNSKTNSERKTHIKLPSQVGKGYLVKWFCENVSELVLGRNIGQIDLSFLYIVSQEVVSHFNVLGFCVEHWVFSNAYGTGAVTKQRQSGTLLTKVAQSVHDPEEL